MLGFARENFPKNKLPGHTNDSYGYKIDGKLFHKKSSGYKKMPKIKNGDIVGCGINFFNREIFFTHNGVYQGNFTIKIS